MPTHKEQATKNFWEQWATIGKELLEHGEQVVFGHSLLEVKYMNGVPAVIVLSKSIKRKYPDNQSAKIAIAKILEESEANHFTGARTFTITLADGNVSHVLLDEYGNTLIR